MMKVNNNKEISVVIPSVNGLPIIKECLESIYRQSDSNIAEVIVVDCSNEQTRKVISETFKEIVLIHPLKKRTIPELRSIGMKAASSDILVMIEDHCLAHEDWFTEILKAHESEYIVIGGAVENACCDRILDWATFFCEYSVFLQPVPFGPVRDLPGNNVSYKRSEIIRLLGESIDEGFWEGFLHAKLMEQGYVLFSNPSIVVYHKKAFGFLEFLLQRFYFSRSFASMRNKELSGIKQLIFIMFCLFLPFLIMLRLGIRVLSKGRLRREFALSVPFLFAFTIVWAIGEFWGYLFGAGDSLLHIK